MRNIPKNLGEVDSPNYYRETLFDHPMKNQHIMFKLFLLDALMDNQTNTFIFAKERHLLQKRPLHFNVVKLPTGPESLNISFQAFGIPEGEGFSLASENSDNCIKYRDFRMKEEVHQDQKEKVKRRQREGTFLYSVQASWHPALIYPHFGVAERAQGKLEDGRVLNYYLFSEVPAKNIPPEGCWLTTQSDTNTTAPTLL